MEPARTNVTNALDGLLRQSAVGLMNHSSTTVQFGYDSASRLQKVTNGAYRATYSFAANSHLVEQVVFNHSANVRMTTTRDHDKLNRLRSITSVAAGTVSSTYAYNPLLSSGLSNGIISPKLDSI